jgi:hypothetical protein
MSDAPIQTVGPFPRLHVNPKVGAYLRHSPTADEKWGMKEFLSKLQERPIATNSKDSPVAGLVSNRFWHFHVCNHIIEICVQSESQAIVTNVYRDVTSNARAAAF